VVFETRLATDDLRNKPCEKHMLEFEESWQAGFHEWFTTQAKS